MLEFISLSGDSPSIDKSTQKRIRSLAMQNFRRRERECYGEAAKGSDTAWRRHRKYAAAAKQKTENNGRSTDEAKVRDTVILHSADPQPTPVVQSHYNERDPRRDKNSAHSDSSCVSTGALYSRTALPDAWSGTVDPEDGTFHSSEHSPANDDPEQRAMKAIATGQLTVHSPMVYRNRGGEAFIKGYLPSETHGWTDVGTRVNQWLTPTTRSMQAAADAICLLEIGSKNRDARMLLGGRQRHVAAIECLRLELQNPKADFTGIHGAAQTLMLCEIYASVSQGPFAWVQHLSGISSVVTIRGRRQSDSSFDVYLYRSLLLFGLMHSLVMRQAIVFSEAKWQDVFTSDPHSIGGLLRLAMQLPAMLGTADAITASAGLDHARVFDCLRHLKVLERDLVSWLAGYYHEGNHSVFDSSSSCEQGQVLSSADEEALSFCSFLDATYHCLYWTCLLLLRRSKLNLSSFLPGALADIDQSKRTSTLLSESIDECASLLCRSLPYLANTARGTVCKAMALRAPLYFASQWFDISHNEEKLKWCKEVERLAREEAFFLDWDALLPWNLFAVMYLDSSRP